MSLGPDLTGPCPLNENITSPVRTFTIKADEMWTRTWTAVEYKRWKALAEAMSPGRKLSHLQRLTFFSPRFSKSHAKLFRESAVFAWHPLTRSSRLKGPYGRWRLRSRTCRFHLIHENKLRVESHDTKRERERRGIDMKKKKKERKSGTQGQIIDLGWTESSN